MALKSDVKESSRKYPNVIWFPRSKTDMREFREVLKIAKIVQEENPAHYFNDKLLGEKMAKIGLINRVGMLPEDYIKSYKDKSTGDVSYITNARMLMRIFRFLGWIRKKEKSQYILTTRGDLHCLFEGDFPDFKNGVSEEKVVLDALKDFAFHSVNDTIENRDLKFKVRPFIWLLYNLSIEPQCIYQLITTCFASRNESPKEIKRITNLLDSLRNKKTNIKREFSILGLDADNYSCVHNFYDSAKILVYLGVKLELIERIANPVYGKQIAGDARHLKQASIFYKLTDKGKKYLLENKDSRLIYFEDLSNNKEIALVLGTLNLEIGNKKISRIKKSYLSNLLNKDISYILKSLKEKRIQIKIENDFISLEEPVSFNFWQSIPYEVIDAELHSKIDKVCLDIIKGVKEMEIIETKQEIKNLSNVSNKVIVDKDIYYELPKFKNQEEMLNYISYTQENSSYGGQDRFAIRISPTNSFIMMNGQIMVDNTSDCLDLLVPLRNPNKELSSFIEKNIKILIKSFLLKTRDWEKDQHYVWVRNCFRSFGCKAIYSGSSGMLMRADVSILSPFLGGIEAKSPRENRGSIASKAIRQADHAKKQLFSLHKSDGLKSVAIAIGRRVTPQAIKEEKDVFRPDGAPVLIFNDKMLYYLSLRFKELNLNEVDLVEFFIINAGFFNEKALLSYLEKRKKDGKINSILFEKLSKEISQLHLDEED
jgi:hypothetical protein